MITVFLTTRPVIFTADLLSPEKNKQEKPEAPGRQAGTWTLIIL